MKLVFLIILTLLFLLLFLEDRQSIILWKNRFQPFPIDEFKSECGNLDIEIGDYSINEKFSLIPTSIIKGKLSDWFIDSDLSIGNKQSKFTFFKNSENKITNFINKWIGDNLNYFPKKFKDRYKDHCEHTIRISRGKWNYPSHFDAVDLFTFVLSGNRHVILNEEIGSKQIKLTLNPGDIFYFVSGIYHNFLCDNELNLVLNISFKPKNKDVDLNFKRCYPQRMEVIATKREYIF